MFRLCVAQVRANLETPASRLDWLRDELPKIQQRQADLVVLPELFACGYHIGAAVQQRAEAANGPTQAKIAGLAQAYGVAIHYGFAEHEDGQLFNSARCIGPDGSVLNHQRKLAIPPGFEREHFTPGSSCEIFHYRGVKMATLICYDAEFPETVRHVAAKGVQLVLVPTALGAEWAWVAQSMLPTRAYENGIYLAYANSAGRENGFDFLGQSVIAAPDGVEVARATDQPELLFADIDLRRVTAAQLRLPYLSDRHQLNF